MQSSALPSPGEQPWRIRQSKNDGNVDIDQCLSGRTRAREGLLQGFIVVIFCDRAAVGCTYVLHSEQLDDTFASDISLELV
jgi:hypothetical protein